MLYPMFDDKLPRGQYMINILRKEAEANVITPRITSYNVCYTKLLRKSAGFAL